MKRFCVIGDPITHSLSPQLHTEIFRQFGVEASYEKICIDIPSLTEFMEHQRFNGINVTIPHKQSVISFLNELDDSAKSIGAVNCIHQGKGYNTDWLGFINAVKLNAVNLQSRDCTLIGAGGAAHAVAFALIQSKVNTISIINRTQNNSQKLARWIKSKSNVSVTLNNIHPIIINCTPLGMWPNTYSLPLPIESTPPDAVLIDTIYNPVETEWLNQGRKKGAKIVGGLDMFIAQGLASAEIWFNKHILEKIELEQIKKVLKSELC